MGSAKRHIARDGVLAGVLGLAITGLRKDEDVHLVWSAAELAAFFQS